MVVKSRQLEQVTEGFDSATKYFQKNGLQSKVSDVQRQFLYGLSKQAHNGDVRGDKPDKADAQGLWKYSAWEQCAGMSKQDAMMAFIVEVKKLDPKFSVHGLFDGGSPTSSSLPGSPAVASSAISTPTGGRGSTNGSPLSASAGVRRSSTGKTDLEAGGAVRMEGVLYKQRDVFKGWRSRDFVLQGTFLHYYMQKDDITPKKSMDVSGCSVIAVGKTKVGDQTLFPFVISHPSSTKSYNLASDTPEGTASWVDVIKEASMKQRSEGSESGEGPYMGRLLDRRPPPLVQDVDMTSEEKFIAESIRPMNPETSLLGMPMRYAGKMESAVESLLDSIGDDSTMQWERLYVKQGVSVFKAAGSSGASAICVRGEATLNYPPTEVFGTLMNPAITKTLNPQINMTEKKKLFSDNTFVEYIKCKQVWPTAVRDYCNLVHWRLLADGKVIICCFSEKFTDFCAVDERNVRAEMILGGYVLSPVEGGKTLVNYILQSDLKGNIPKSISTMVASQQPLLVANIAKIIENNHARVKGMGHDIPIMAGTATTFDGLMHAYRNPGDFGLDPDGKAAVYIGPDHMHSAPPSTPGADAPAVAASKSPVAGAPIFSPSVAKTPTSPTPASPAGVAAVTSSAAATALLDEKRVTLLTMLTLFTPVLAWYVVPNQHRTLAFIVGFVICVRYVFRVHMGEARTVSSVKRRAALSNGNFVVKMPIDLGKLTRYLKSKREETGVEVTLTSLAVKAAGLAIKHTENGALNGHTFMGAFYPSQVGGVDVSVTTEMGENTMATFKVVDAERKPVDYISTELRKKKQELQSGSAADGSVRAKLRAALPQLLSNKFDDAMEFVGTTLGVSVPALGIEAHPLGVCTILYTAPIIKDQESSVDVTFTPNFEESSAPLHITIGGVRMVTGVDDKQQVKVTPMLSVSIAVNSKAVSIGEARMMSARFHEYMSDPGVLDKMDRRHAQLHSK